MGKINIENFQVSDIHWLYRTSQYAICNVDVTERKEIITHHSIAQYGGRLQSKYCITENHLPEMKGMQEKESIMGVRDS